MSVGDESGLLWLQTVLECRFEISPVVLGPGPDNCKFARVLNGIITASDRRYTYEADARHAELIVRDLNLQNAKALSSPGTDMTQEGGEALLDHQRFKQFQSMCARANFWSTDRSGLRHAATYLCRPQAHRGLGSTKTTWQVLGWQAAPAVPVRLPGRREQELDIRRRQLGIQFGRQKIDQRRR